MNERQRKLLDRMVVELHMKCGAIVMAKGLSPLDGLCVTYSRVVAEVLTEYGLKSQCRPVFVANGDDKAREAMKQNMTPEQAKTHGAKINTWGEFSQGKLYQHAVVFIQSWNTVIDLSMHDGQTKTVGARPYWFSGNRLPPFMLYFEFRKYRLESGFYQCYPAEVSAMKKMVREIMDDYVSGK